MRKIVFLSSVLLLLLLSGAAVAQQLPYAQQQEVNRLFKKSSVVYFRFNVRSLQEVGQFGKVLSVDKTQGATVFAHANKAQFTNFMRMNYAYKVLPSPQAKKKPATKTAAAGAKKPATTAKKPATAPSTAKKAPVKK